MLKSLRSRIAIFLAVLGPGFITANVDNDAGGIYTYSQAGARWGEGIEHDPPADRGNRRERAQHKSVSAARHYRSLEHEARDAPLPGSDRGGLHRARQDLGGAEMHTQARP